MRRSFSISRLTASVGPFEAPPVASEARISWRQRSTVRARLASPATLASAACWNNTIRASTGSGGVGCGVDVAEQLAGEPHGGDLAAHVAGGEASAEAFPALVLEVGRC